MSSTVVKGARTNIVFFFFFFFELHIKKTKGIKQKK